MPLVLKPQKKTSEIDFESVRKIAQELCCDELFALVLYNRGFKDATSCREFLFPDETALLLPLSMLNMDKVVERVMQAKEKNEKVTIYGDYDVDGVSATAIMVLTLRKLGIKAEYYIPSRHSEGYGLNNKAIDIIAANETNLLITVDCGIQSAKEIEYAENKGLDCIVTDHHTIGNDMPACTVLKPGQPGDGYVNTDLCGAGIAFKISQALLGKDAEEFFDIAATATVADVVSLKGENRYIVKKGLEKLNKNPNKAYKALLDAAEFDKEVTAQAIGFTIAPRINAAGRMAHGSEALEMFLSTQNINERAKKLCEYNDLRRQREKEIFLLADEQVKKTVSSSKVLIAAGENWEDGVIGICAARLCEKYNRPSIVFSLHNGIAKGSGRSVEGVDLFYLLSCASDILEQFGGHKMAAGMSVRQERLEELRICLNNALRENFDLKLLYPSQNYDAKAELKDITIDFCKELALIQPCGCGNGEVKLRIDSCLCGGMRKIGAEGKHLKMFLQDDTSKCDAVAFNYGTHQCDYFNLSEASFIVYPEINFWQNKESVNLRVADVKENGTIKTSHLAEELTASFFEHLALKKDGSSNVKYFDDLQDLMYNVVQWADDDISGTLVLCDHPEYAASCIKNIIEETPRFDISMHVPLNENNGYNSLVLAPEIKSIDFTAFRRIIIFDLVNSGYADALKKLAPHAELYALKCGRDLFLSIYEEYRSFSREDMQRAYRAICSLCGFFTSRNEFLKAVSTQKQVYMPLASVALDVFCELDFFSVENENGFTVIKNENKQKRTLEESTLYCNILKCF